MSSPQGAAVTIPQRLKALQMMVGAMGAALPIIGVIGFGVLLGAELQPTHLVVVIGIPVVTLAIAHLMTGRLIQPLRRDEADPVAVGFERLRSATMVQAALAESGGLVVFALAFVVGINPILVLIGMVVSAIGVFAVAWPARGRLTRVRRQLEREGASCPLDELAEGRR